MEGTSVPRPLVRLQAWFTDWLIDLSVRRHFRAVYARAEPPPATKPLILFANHHYWWDGYLAYCLLRAWGRSALVWMEAYRRFPPFGALGALPFPPNNPAVRACTIRRTLQALQSPQSALLLFPEGTLHGDTERLLPFQRSLHWLACRLPDTMLLPLAIHIESSYHQYPRAYLAVGEPFSSEQTECAAWLHEASTTLMALLQQVRADARAATDEPAIVAQGYHVLVRGKPSIHERWRSV